MAETAPVVTVLIVREVVAAIEMLKCHVCAFLDGHCSPAK
jgi:hypothetical protein